MTHSFFEKKNEKIKLFTRGTADEGQDITPLTKYLSLPSYEEIKKYVNNYENKLLKKATKKFNL